MNKREKMLVSITAITLVGVMLLLSGIFGKAVAFNPTGSPDYTLQPIVSNGPTGEATKIIVEIDSPYGFERITSFSVMQTDNLMQILGYHTLKLQGFIHADKRTLLNWIAQDLGKLPDGLSIDGVFARGGDYSRMTKAKPNSTITMVPMTGTVRVQLLEDRASLFAEEHEKLRQLEFSGCHVAGYDIFTHNDERREYLSVGIIHVEQVTFACTAVRDLNAISMNSRGIIVDTAINNEGRKIMNEKGELIINSREYRQPIVMDNDQKEENSLKLEIVATAVTDNTYYQIGEPATFMVTFTDLEGVMIEPDTIKAYFDGKMIQLEQQDTGVYIYTTPGLTKEHHQLIVSAEKEDFATDTIYLSLPMHRIS